MSKTAKSFARKSRVYKQESRILVICEDKKSSKFYLDDAARYFGAHPTIEFTHCGKTDPYGIVSSAILRKDEFDKVICVIDRDDHKKFDEAISLAESNSIEVQVSFPCFEFWYLMHFDYNRKPYKLNGNKSAADLLIDDLEKIDIFKNYDKGKTVNIFEKLKDRLPTAMRFGKKSLLDAIQECEENPSTPTHKMMEFLQTLGSPQPVEPK